MMNIMRDSSLYIAVEMNAATMTKEVKSEVDNTFKNILGESVTVVSDVKDENIVELVYRIKTPIINDGVLVDEFFENLEILLEEIQEYNPHFTQFRGGINA